MFFGAYMRTEWLFRRTRFTAAGADAAPGALHLCARERRRVPGGQAAGTEAHALRVLPEEQPVMSDGICAQRKLATPSTGFRGCGTSAGRPLQAATRAAASQHDALETAGP